MEFVTDSMQSCLLAFLAKYKSLENIIYEAAPEKIRSAANAIQNKFKMDIQHKYATLRWKRHEEDNGKLEYRRGTKEFRELRECQGLLFGARLLLLNDYENISAF
jgi:hypothetical protein